MATKSPGGTGAARGAEAVRSALIAAAMELLPKRAPSTVSGRELAERAGVNYGLVYHYFGGKDAVFREAIDELRDQFLSEMGNPPSAPVLTSAPHPYLLAIGRSMIDYPNDYGPSRDFPIGRAAVRTLQERLDIADPTEAECEAKARALMLLAMQLGYGLYRGLLLDTVDVSDEERTDVEAVMVRLHRRLARNPDEPETATGP